MALTDTPIRLVASGSMYGSDYDPNANPFLNDAGATAQMYFADAGYFGPKTGYQTVTLHAWPNKPITDDDVATVIAGALAVQTHPELDAREEYLKYLDEARSWLRSRNAKPATAPAKRLDPLALL